MDTNNLVKHNYGLEYGIRDHSFLVRQMAIFDLILPPVRVKLHHTLMAFDPVDVVIEQRKPGRTVQFLLTGLQKADEKYHAEKVQKKLALKVDGNRFELTAPAVDRQSPQANIHRRREALFQARVAKLQERATKRLQMLSRNRTSAARLPAPR